MKPGAMFTAGACALAIATAAMLPVPTSQAQNAPRYEADVNWPKPLPERWVLGGLGGICVDAKDHVLILNRQDVIEGDLNGGTLAPPMIEFDPVGNVVHSWGDPRACTRATSRRTATCGSPARPPAWCRNIPTTAASSCCRSA